MTTKCYEVVLRKFRKSYNDGYIVVQIENNEIKSLEGIFTCDYLTSEISKDRIILENYTLSENGRMLEKDFQIGIFLKEFKFPINISIDLGVYLLELLTKKEIKDERVIKDYQEQLKRFKATKIFR